MIPKLIPANRTTSIISSWLISQPPYEFSFERRIQRADIKPLTYEAMYPLDTLDKIKDVTIGRPKKVAPEKPAKKGKK